MPFGDRMSIMSTGCNISYDDARKLSEVLHLWRDRKTEVSWEKIISVVYDCPVENKRIADEICEFLAKPEIMNEYLFSDQPGKIKIIVVDKIIL